MWLERSPSNQQAIDMGKREDILSVFRFYRPPMENLVYFFTPSQVAANEAPQGRTFRIGGMVEKGSVKRQPDGVTVQFLVTDTAKTIPVTYRGPLPDLFKEGKGVVAQGQLGADGVFRATEVLAKHDENYMPPEAAEAVKKAQETAEKTARTLKP